MAQRIRRLQARLAPGVDIEVFEIDWVPDRPKGMRSATYRRLVDRLEQVSEKRDAYLEPGLLRVLARCPTDDLTDLLRELS
jgi:hypothetical protein